MRPKETDCYPGCLKTADIFSGIGGIRLGFQRACEKVGVKHVCLFAKDINKRACDVYQASLDDSIDPLGDITKQDPSEIPDFDVLLAGFPCQAFSLAGNKKGFDDVRGTLFFNLAEILNIKKPMAFLFENVKGLVHHNGGKTLGRILDITKELGYNTKHIVLNSKNFGVPQNRPRVYIVGFRGFGGGFEWPQPTDSSKRLSDILEKKPVDKKFYLSVSYWETLVRHKKRQQEKGHGFGYDIKTEDDVSSTIMCGGMGRERNLLIDKKIGKIPEGANDQWIRTITPTEWERLQGFPENWTDMVPDSVRMDLLGNSVTVNVIEAISCKMLEEIKNPKTETGLFE